MFYLKFGNSKKCLLFLHGWGADMNSFLWLREYFENEYSLIFVDFDGFGKSEFPNNAMFVSDFAENVKKILDEFCFESVNIVGHSFGGRVAIKFLFYYSSCYKNVSLCLVDSAGLILNRGIIYKIKVSRYKKLKKKFLIKPCNKKLEQKLREFGSSDYRCLNNIMKKTFVNVVNEDLSKYARFLKCKTIIIWGRYDKETKLVMAKKFKRLIKDSRLFVFGGSGHFSFLENKEDFVIILDTFLKNL